MTHDLAPLSSATWPQSTWLIEQLPAVMGEDEFLRRFLGIFEEIIETLSERVDGFDHYIDVSISPIDFVRWIGRWVGLEVPPTLEPDRQRDLVRKFGPLFGWRGTAVGLERLLEAVTGERVRVSDSGGVFGEGDTPVNSKLIHVDLDGVGMLSDEQVAGVVQNAVPADCTFELRVAGRLVPPPSTSPRLEKAPTVGEDALMGFTTGARPLLDDAAIPTRQPDPDVQGTEPPPGTPGDPEDGGET